MGLVEVVGRLLAGVAVMLVGALGVFVDADRVVATLRNPLSRVVDVAPHLGVLVAVLVVNRVFRHLGQELAWIIGWKITGEIYAVEGNLVATIQSVQTPWLTRYFSFMYLYGYVFVTVFPIVAYWVLEDPRPIRQTIIAYAANYGIGLVFYTLFISYGPRNLLPRMVDSLLYSTYPQAQLLTSTVNTNTNVFPSLHTSLSVTVLLLAYRTRDVYPRWFLLTVPVVTSVVVSTLYLGIHWAIDVVAGALLAVVAVRLGDRYHDLRGAFGWRSPGRR